MKNVAFILFVLVAASSQEIWADSGTLSRFLEEAPGAWEECRSHYSQKTYEVTTTIAKQGGFSTTIVTGDVEIGDGYYRVLGTMETKLSEQALKKASKELKAEAERLDAEAVNAIGKEEVATVWNSDYRAGIKLKPKPMLGDYSPRSEESDRDASRRGICPALNVMKDHAEELFDEEKWKAVDAREVQEDGDDCVEVDFVVVDKSQGELSAKILFVPGRKWCVRRAERVNKAFAKGVFQRCSYTFSAPDSPHPTAKKSEIVVHHTNGSKEKVLSETAEFGELKECSLSESDCRLAAFGLPEPGSSANPFRTTALIVLAAIAGVAVVMMRRKPGSAAKAAKAKA